ncbi:hypothetical protein AS180_15405 [Priestia veravalensis]|uniref:DUF7668 domain-containing protein n=1 Tax=Priestia veravalensis TaxID=1414648 RepID=A0A0V8JK42_9BACI|nr:MULTISPECIES: hypothetical protein [Priestia]KSU87040.1 hypothetical protein AS180_15405 [Priestia veravalensis]SCC44199.1 hypothetical protein GA0061087_104530 [Priestia flexa]
MENVNKVKELIKGIVQELVQHNIESLPLEDDSEISNLKEELSLYPGVMTFPPEVAYDQLEDGFYIDQPDAPHFSLGKKNVKKQFPKLIYMVDFDLYYDNERSNLTLQCNIYENKSGDWMIKVSDIHVM